MSVWFTGGLWCLCGSQERTLVSVRCIGLWCLCSSGADFGVCVVHRTLVSVWDLFFPTGLPIKLVGCMYINYVVLSLSVRECKFVNAE